MQKITIEGVAIVNNSNGIMHVLPRPHRHKDILNYLKQNKIEIDNYIEGFVTNTGTFVTRKEAKIIAIDAGQIINNYNTGPLLWSDDVW